MHISWWTRGNVYENHLSVSVGENISFIVNLLNLDHARVLKQECLLMRGEEKGLQGREGLRVGTEPSANTEIMLLKYRSETSFK